MALGAAVIDPPQFDSVHAALRFAYGIAEQPIIQSPALGRMRGAETPGELTQWDKHAQSGLIRAHINRLPMLSCGYIQVHYSWGPERYKGRVVVVNWLMSYGELKKGMSRESPRVFAVILEQYCGRRASTKLIQDLMSVTRWRARKKRIEVFDALDTLHNQAFELLDREFRRQGLI